MTEEEALVRAFIVKTKRDRFVELLASAKRRRDVTTTLAHSCDLDSRYVVRLDASHQDSQSVARVLRQRGAGQTCHVISENGEIDGQRLPLEEALNRVIGHGSGTLLSCIPGVLAYFEGEDPGRRCILSTASLQPAKA